MAQKGMTPGPKMSGEEDGGDTGFHEEDDDDILGTPSRFLRKHLKCHFLQIELNRLFLHIFSIDYPQFTSRL
jgi:hypothetical protein